MNVDVSPDGQTVIFDLLGDLYSIPMAGGTATPLTVGRPWDQAPQYSPDGQSVYFVSDQKGFKNIWRLSLLDHSLTQITHATADVVGPPNWAESGTELLVGVDAMDSEVFLHSVDITTGGMMPVNPPEGPAFDWSELRPLRPYVRIFSAVQAADGHLYYSMARNGGTSGPGLSRIYAIQPGDRQPKPLTVPSAPYSEYKPQLSPDGNSLAYFRQYGDRRTELRLRDRAAGRDVLLLELPDIDDATYGAAQDVRPNYSFTPDSRAIVFWYGGRIHHFNIAERSNRIIPFAVTVHREVWQRAQPIATSPEQNRFARVIRWPSISRDGKTMSFSAFGYVWVLDTQSGHVRRLTASEDLEYMPAISPDGQFVAFVSYAKSDKQFGPGRLLISSVGQPSGTVPLVSDDASYLLPRWSSDGTKIVAIRELVEDGRLKAVLGWIEIANGEFKPIATIPASDDYAAGHVYSRSASFDDAGQKVFFSYPESKDKVVLAVASLEGGPIKLLAVGDPDVAAISPSPDGKQLALTRNDGSIWLFSSTSTNETTIVSTLSSQARRISDIGGFYVNWFSPFAFTYGLAHDVYRYDARENSLNVLRVELHLPRRCAGPPWALTGARLLTMTSPAGKPGIIEPGTVVIRGERIVAAGPSRHVAIPDGATLVEVSGKTVIPGLIDSHYHRIGGSGGAVGLSALKLPNPSFSDKSAIGYGITAAWEPGGVRDDGAPATADLQAAGRILGPQWSHSAQGAVGYPWTQLNSFDRALAAVDRQRALGVMVLKEYNTPTRTQRQWLSAAAHARELGIVSHLESLEGMMTRVIDGYTGGEHAMLPVPFYDDVLELLRSTGYVWTPNISIAAGSIGRSSDPNAYFWKNVREQRSGELEKLKRMTSPDRVDETTITEPSVPYAVHRVSRIAEQAAIAALSGVHIGVSGHNMPGLALHKEMWFLRRGGMPAYATLRAATLGNAKKLGISADLGTLEPGKLANMLVLDEDPLRRMLNTLSIKYTIQRGVIYSSDTAEILRPEDVTPNETRFPGKAGSLH